MFSRTGAYFQVGRGLIRNNVSPNKEAAYRNILNTTGKMVV